MTKTGSNSSLMKRRGDPDAGPQGIIAVDKPLGISSHGVVARVRRIAGTRRVGHAGTLDPDASGVLILGLGRATKLLGFIAGTSKEYLATIRLGVETNTDDAAGEVTRAQGCSQITQITQVAHVAQSTRTADDIPAPLTDLIEHAMSDFVGDIQQVPSSVSAIKVNGKRAYSLARAGEEVKLKSRQVTVDRFSMVGEPRVEEIQMGDDPLTVVDIDVVVDCSTGTYVRALARDLGRALGVGGHLTALLRTRVGPWTLADCVTLDQLEDDAGSPEALPLIGMGTAASRVLPSLVITNSAASRFLHGAAPQREDVVRGLDDVQDQGVAAVFSGSDTERLLGLISVDGGRLKIQAVLASPASSA